MVSGLKINHQVFKFSWNNFMTVEVSQFSPNISVIPINCGGLFSLQSAIVVQIP